MVHGASVHRRLFERSIEPVRNGTATGSWTRSVQKLGQATTPCQIGSCRCARVSVNKITQPILFLATCIMGARFLLILQHRPQALLEDVVRAGENHRLVGSRTKAPVVCVGA